MHNEKEALLAAVERYRKAISTQQAEDFFPLWARDVEVSLISLSNLYTGLQSVYEDFLLGGIRKAYSRIELITRSVRVNRLTPDCAVVLFSYRTDCTRRETGEYHSISGLETQVYIRQEGVWKLAHVQYAKED